MASNDDRPSGGLPLENLRIIELAHVVAGPSVGKHLSDFGADVIKVERPGEGDASRSMGESIGSRSAFWLGIGRNKRSIAIDLAHPLGREALLRLISDADAVVESFRPGVLERLDLAPDVLTAHNERLVVVRLSAYGQEGPYSTRPGFGTLAEAFSGLAAISGYDDQPPLLASFALADEVAGLFATWALLVAIYHRDVNGGPGQTIDVSLFESVFNILGPLPTLWQHNGHVQSRNGSRLPFSSPRNVYRTRDGQYFAISGTTPSASEAIVRIVGGNALLADPHYATHEGRAKHADALDELVAQWIAERDHKTIEDIFELAGAPGIRVLTIKEIFEDEHYRARGTIIQVEDEELGEVAIAATVPRMSATPGRIDRVGVPLGADTDELLAELGYTAEEIAEGRRSQAW